MSVSVATRPGPAPVDGVAVELYSPWRIAWRRFLRDKVAVASGIFLIFLLLAVLPGAKLASVVLGPGPDDLYPYAVNSDTLIFRHALPNTVLPVVTMLAMDIGTAVGICIYIEAVFRMPGLGYQTLQSLGGLGLDLPMLIGITLFTGTMIIVLNLFVDLLAVIIDPTITTSPRAGRSRFGASAGSDAIA